MMASRILAAVLVVGAGAWIASGYVGRGDGSTPRAAATPQPIAVAEEKLFKVAVMPVALAEKSRKLWLSGFTEADRRVMATARTNGVVVELKVRPGARVEAGQVIAVLSDEARDSAVTQARAKVEQRKAEWKAREPLIARGVSPAINRPQFEAELKAAEAALAQAEAELARGQVTAPIGGIVDKVPAEIGQALAPGGNVAEVIALNPMLAIAEISERRLGVIKVGDPARIRLVSGQEVAGKVRFISNRASPQTRTYRIEVEIPNADFAIRDGVTCEVEFSLPAVASAQLPRSALTFSSEGRLGVRVVEEGKVAFKPVTLVEDSNDTVHVAGLAANARVIVQGQDFVREGQRVEAVGLAGL
jgi:multidrug efflux system membrane fusion protein